MRPAVESAVHVRPVGLCSPSVTVSQSRLRQQEEQQQQLEQQEQRPSADEHVRRIVEPELQRQHRIPRNGIALPQPPGESSVNNHAQHMTNLLPCLQTHIASALEEASRSSPEVHLALVTDTPSGIQTQNSHMKTSKQ